MTRSVRCAGFQISNPRDFKPKMTYPRSMRIFLAVSLLILAPAAVVRADEATEEKQYSLKQRRQEAEEARWAGDFDKCIGLFLELHEEYKGTLRESGITLRLSEVYDASGDEDKKVEWLIRTAELKTTFPTKSGLWQFKKEQWIAMERLAIHYEEQGDWAEALRWWRAWEPPTMCGNCLIGLYKSRNRHIEQCETNLLNEANLFQYCLMVIPYRPETYLLLAVLLAFGWVMWKRKRRNRSIVATEQLVG